MVNNQDVKQFKENAKGFHSTLEVVEQRVRFTFLHDIFVVMNVSTKTYVKCCVLVLLCYERMLRKYFDVFKDLKAELVQAFQDKMADVR